MSNCWTVTALTFSFLCCSVDRNQCITRRLCFWICRLVCLLGVDMITKQVLGKFSRNFRKCDGCPV